MCRCLFFRLCKCLLGFISGWAGIMYRGTDTKRLQLSKQDDNMLPKRKKNGKARGDLKEFNTANEWAGEQISGVPFPNPTAACQTKAWVTAHWSFYFYFYFFWVPAHGGSRKHISRCSRQHLFLLIQAASDLRSLPESGRLYEHAVSDFFFFSMTVSFK